MSNTTNYIYKFEAVDYTTLFISLQQQKKYQDIMGEGSEDGVQGKEKVQAIERGHILSR